MRTRLRNALLGLAGLAAALLAGAVIVALDSAGPGKEALRGPMMLYALAGALVFAVGALGFWRVLDRGVVRPMAALARDVHTLLQAKRIDRALRIPEGHGLGDLPGAIDTLVDELRRARRDAVRAMATATSRVEQEKTWLEVILLELVREGVVVCSADHRILLYNHPAARLFRGSLALGLGRSLFDVIAEAPVRHALERLEFRRQSQRRDLSAPLVCATRDARLMLSARLALILDPGDRPNGYVLAMEDISAEMAERRRNEWVRRTVTQDLRGPLASLRAAAETLAAFPDIGEEDRRAFHEVIIKESTALSEHLASVAEAYEGRTVGHWPMTEIHSPDLFSCLARQLREQDGIELAVVGEPEWLEGDSHVLMQVLAFLVGQLTERTGARRFEVEAGADDARAYIELRWAGAPVPSTTLDEWLSATPAGLPGSTAGEALEQHGSEPWSRAAGSGQAVLHIPLQPPEAGKPSAEEGALPPRPEFYDFDLMHAHSVPEGMAERRLRDLSYVVFDTETTGLNPSGGDQIISIAAVRVTQGRVLEGETFETLVNPGRTIPTDSIRFHGITDDMVADAPSITEVLPDFHLFAGDAVLVAHNAAFDMKFLKMREAECGIRFTNPVMDTLLLSLLIDGEDEDHSLDGICERLGLSIENRHSALGDAVATAKVLAHFLDRLEAKKIETFGQVMDASNMEAALRFRAGHF